MSSLEGLTLAEITGSVDGDSIKIVSDLLKLGITAVSFITAINTLS